MLSQEELDAMVEAEEKRLGVGSKEFIQRHNEIMELIDEARGKGAVVDGMCKVRRYDNNYGK